MFANLIFPLIFHHLNPIFYPPTPFVEEPNNIGLIPWTLEEINPFLNRQKKNIPLWVELTVVYS